MDHFTEKLPPMDLMRSEKMTFVQLIIPAESAHRCITYLGQLGLLQFRDVTSLSDLNLFLSNSAFCFSRLFVFVFGSVFVDLNAENVCRYLYWSLWYCSNWVWKMCAFSLWNDWSAALLNSCVEFWNLVQVRRFVHRGCFIVRLSLMLSAWNNYLSTDTDTDMSMLCRCRCWCTDACRTPRDA
jgi:hypothetical protein